MKKVLLLSYAIAVTICLFAQEKRLVIDNQTPGWLSSLLTYSQQQSVEELTLTGYISKADMSFVCNLIKNQNLKILDVTDAVLISSENGENYIWSDFLNFGNTKVLQKLRMPKLVKGVNWAVLGSDFTPVISSQVDTLEMGYEDMSVFTKFQDYRDGESICKYPPQHLILLDGVKIIPNNCFTYSGGYQSPTGSCFVTLPNTITHIGGRAFDSTFIFNDFTFPENIEYIGRHPVMNIIANRSQVHGLAPENCWAYNSTINISKERFVFPNNLHFYNSLHYEGSSLKGYDIVVYDSYTSDTIIVGPKCDTLFTKLNAKIAYFYNENPVKSYSFSDFCIDTLYVPEGSLSRYLDEYNYVEALRIESGQQIKAIKEMISVKGIEISNDSLSCIVGEELNLYASILPADAFNKNFLWETSDASIATVDNKGWVFAKKAGEVWILAISAENNEIRDSCKVTVIQPATGIVLSQSICRLTSIGERFTLEATVQPADATNKTVEWNSSNEDVCIVAHGIIVATGYGNAIISATTIDGGYTATCEITVTQPVESLVLEKQCLNLKVGETVELLAQITPATAENKKIVWSSSDEQLATVSTEGTVTALGIGTVWIYAVSEDNVEAKDSCNIKITNGIEITDNAITWNDTVFVYTGLSPRPTWENKLQEYEVTANIPKLEKNVGSWEAEVPFTFTDGVDTLVASFHLRYTIEPVPLTIKANDAERYLGEENPEFTLAYEGFVNEETDSVLTKKPIAYTEATKDSPVGTYTIIVSGAEADNYTIEYVDGTLTIKERTGEVDEDVTDVVTAGSVTLKAGENTTLTVSLTTSDTDYNGYQFNLYLPEGISMATDEDGNYLVTEKTGREKVALGVSDGSVLFYTTADKSHDALASGPLMEIELTADSVLDAGDYTLRIERVVCATRDNKSVSLPSSTVTVTVEKETEAEVPALVTAEDVEGLPAGAITLPVFLNNPTDINAFYFDLTLPKGITVAEDESGSIMASLVGDYAEGKMLLTVQPWDASMGTTNNVNTWRFIATPMDESLFLANAGHVLNVTLNVDEDMASGVYTARMNVVNLVEANGNAADSRSDNGRHFQVLRSPATASWTSYSSITIKTAMKGDVNGDNVVDVADIATVISVMASDATLGSVAHYADVNGDGTVDVADIAAVISEMAARARQQNVED